MTAKQARNTRIIELVETHNLCLSFKRLREAPNYDDKRVARALYHAWLMSYSGDGWQQNEELRKVLKLP